MNGTYLSVLKHSGGKEKVEDLLFIKERVEDGDLRPIIDRIYSIEQIRLPTYLSPDPQWIRIARPPFHCQR